ncbi:LURP-one-related/scramblase family protein [Microbacterium sp. G2-8]|uniref:LURP-one-related/scramblase family protein n=1 Tax=Microbacterium sp. G2-8 TaxID=2842454 RepID=UPI001C8A7572|nr:LURP-one-related family protein [Microbacterium sp. G2-8]
MSILTHDVLVFQQTRNFSKNDFAIMDGQGQQIAHVETGGSTMGRMFMGARELTVFDGPGNPLIHIRDTVTFGRDRMEILDADGTLLANLVKRIAFFKTHVTLDVQGEEIHLEGNIFGFDFQIVGQYGVMASASRQWSGMGAALMGMSTYGVQLAPNLTETQRKAIIGATLALDLIREKQSRG